MPKPLHDLHWPSIRWYAWVHLMGALGVWYLYKPFDVVLPAGSIAHEFLRTYFGDTIIISRYSHWALAISVALFFLVHLSIGALAHRYYSHRSYVASARMQYMLLPFFAAAAQGPMLYWALIHVDHHADTDGPGDRHSPYRSGNGFVGRIAGFFYSQMGWPCTNHGKREPRMEVLKAFMRNKDAYVPAKWEKDNHKKLAFRIGFVLPIALCSLVGDPVTGMTVGWGLRLVCNYHGTWIVNSIAHTIGKVTKPGQTARNAWWWLQIPLGIASIGEANNHAEHHDDTNRWILGWFDPAGWFIWCWMQIRLASENEPKTATA